MIKRGLDLLLAAFGLMLLSPLLFALSVMIRFSDGGTVFFVQPRVGRFGKMFRMLKFRSMVTGAHKGAALTVGNDSRITPIGRFLRGTKLDELPQLINVLKGEMSFVGPRPEVAKFVDVYTPAQREVLRLRPGITDPASFVFFDESALLAKVADPERYYREQLMAEKIRINLDYAAKAWWGTDLLLIAATVFRIFGLRLDIFKMLEIELPRLKVGP